MSFGTPPEQTTTTPTPVVSDTTDAGSDNILQAIINRDVKRRQGRSTNNRLGSSTLASQAKTLLGS